MGIAEDVVRHHLALHGTPQAHVFTSDEPPPAGASGIVLQPGERTLGALDIEAQPGGEPPAVVSGAELGLARLRTLHPFTVFAANDLQPLVVDDRGRAVWARVRRGGADLILVGTELAGDLIRYRQGDPAAAAGRPADPLWGYAGERPQYLFDAQLAGEQPEERHADLWSEAAARALGGSREPILPGGAAGAVVVTGDDDQAYLEAYDRQRDLLGDVPVTYFLHPLTRHTPETLAALRARGVELELHPDALDAPDHYAELLAEQAAWFEQLTGERPRAVRNHGYLNDGYWGHLDAWLAEGIATSANLPGVDGRVLNGSLLPARVVRDDVLTPHWSVLTVLGDGLVWALDFEPEAAGDRVREVAERIRRAPVPGVIVLNLHPQSVHPESVKRADHMHDAVREIVADGFVAWTLSECVAWFAERDSERDRLTSMLDERESR